MPQVKYAPGAIRDLQRLREFLQPKNPVAAKRVAESIMKAVQLLGQHVGLRLDQASASLPHGAQLPQLAVAASHYQRLLA